MDNKPPYFAYLLRLWSVQEEEVVVWRASLESPQTGERLGFSTLARLFAFLEDQTGRRHNGDEYALKNK
jgi:hypothetical protein